MQPILNALMEISDNHFWTVAALCCGILVAVAAIADRRRNRRVQLEDVGFMPWTGITVMAVLLTVMTIALAIKSELSL